ncbi:MAG: hypothetical protein Q8S58_19880, partial [Bosea sp. (in: a-proteobacteria)]|nr:hypothetical protein [Bosea sp. (in: a-proteobacteria)]
MSFIAGRAGSPQATVTRVRTFRSVMCGVSNASPIARSTQAGFMSHRRRLRRRETRLMTERIREFL